MVPGGSLIGADLLPLPSKVMRYTFRMARPGKRCGAEECPQVILSVYTHSGG